MAALNHTQLLHALAQKTGRVVDLAYMGLVSSMTQQFFKHGFGQLELIDFHLDVELFKRWPPDHFDDAITPVEWKRVKEGSYHGHAYEVLKGTFRTPCFGKIYDALPTESRTASAMWILPKRPAHQTACMVHLAATGDHGHARRLHLGLPLVEQGIATLALESPYYGERKPGYQQGSKLHHVSDLLLLGRATIEESLFLLQWLAKQGHTQLGMAGLSMGGVHASMVASLYPGPLALTPLLAPRSAAVAYCGGALYHATAWDKIVADAEQRLGDIVRVVHSAARGGEMIAAARIKRIAEEAAALQAAQQAAQQAQHEAEAAGVEGYPGGLPAGALASPGSGSSEAISQATYIATSAAAAGAGSSQQQQQQEGAQQRLGSTTGAASAEQPMGPPRAGAASSSKGSSWNWKRIGKWLHLYSDSLEGRLEQVQALDARDRRQQAVTVLREVLETYTDVTRFPRPQCPQAAILVAATDDAYVSCESVMELHQHWPGSEVRLVPGGHVSSFLLHHETFRQAIRDALDRLPPSCKDT